MKNQSLEWGQTSNWLSVLIMGREWQLTLPSRFKEILFLYASTVSKTLSFFNNSLFQFLKKLFSPLRLLLQTYQISAFAFIFTLTLLRLNTHHAGLGKGYGDIIVPIIFTPVLSLAKTYPPATSIICMVTPIWRHHSRPIILIIILCAI